MVLNAKVSNIYVNIKCSACPSFIEIGFVFKVELFQSGELISDQNFQCLIADSGYINTLGKAS